MLAAAAAAVLFATGCGSTPAPAAAPSTPSSSPAAAPSSAQPSPDVDPACALPELDKYLSEVDAYSKRGVFEVGASGRLNPDKVLGWRLALGAVESAAELKVYKAAVAAKETLESWSEATGSETQQVYTLTIQITASTLAYTCKVHQKYEFTRK
jgi:hypothetical protein